MFCCRGEKVLTSTQATKNTTSKTANEEVEPVDEDEVELEHEEQQLAKKMQNKSTSNAMTEQTMIAFLCIFFPVAFTFLGKALIFFPETYVPSIAL